MNELERIEARLKALEDQLEIMRLFVTHPLAIDAGEADFWMANWTDDAVMDRTHDPEKHSGDYQGVYGKTMMTDEINSPELSALRASGLMHICTSPVIVIEADTASATNYTELISLEGNGYRTRRIVANRWDLRREDGRWKITRRTIRPMGHGETVGIIRRGLPLPRS